MPALPTRKRQAIPASTIVGSSGAGVEKGEPFSGSPTIEMLDSEMKAPFSAPSVTLMEPFRSKNVPFTLLLVSETVLPVPVTLKITWFAVTPPLRVMFELVREVAPETLKTNVSFDVPSMMKVLFVMLMPLRSTTFCPALPVNDTDPFANLIWLPKIVLVVVNPVAVVEALIASVPACAAVGSVNIPEMLEFVKLCVVPDPSPTGPVIVELVTLKFAEDPPISRMPYSAACPRLSVWAEQREVTTRASAGATMATNPKLHGQEMSPAQHIIFVGLDVHLLGFMLFNVGANAEPILLFTPHEILLTLINEWY